MERFNQEEAIDKLMSVVPVKRDGIPMALDKKGEIIRPPSTILLLINSVKSLAKKEAALKLKIDALVDVQKELD